MKARLQILFFALVLAATVQAWWQHGRLPERVAAHFDGAGRTNAWMSRSGQTALNLLTLAFFVALIQGIVALNARLPKEYINLPRRDYWLAPERAAATHAWLASMILFIGCALVAFFMVIFHLIYRANLNDAPRLGMTIWYFTAVFLATLVGTLAAMLARFGRAPAA